MQCVLQSPELKVAINLGGAEICSVKNVSNLEFIWQGKPDVWARHAPVLFPIVGKLKDNFFIYQNTKYELPQHGFARDLEFELINATINTCVFELKHSPKTKVNFPFDFTFQIKYQVIENKVVTKYTIVNPSNEPIFFSVGAHPAFNCPLLPNEKFEDYYLEFEKEELWLTQLNNGLRLDKKEKISLNQNKLPISEALFNKDALVFENNQINKVSLCSSKSKHKVTLTSVNWPYFGIWSKKDCNQFVCLEPWQGIADKETSAGDLVFKDGIIELAPNTEFSCEFDMVFS